jgi:hypothetical protein
MQTAYSVQQIEHDGLCCRCMALTGLGTSLGVGTGTCRQKVSRSIIIICTCLTYRSLHAASCTDKSVDHIVCQPCIAGMPPLLLELNSHDMLAIKTAHRYRDRHLQGQSNANNVSIRVSNSTVHCTLGGKRTTLHVRPGTTLTSTSAGCELDKA